MLIAFKYVIHVYASTNIERLNKRKFYLVEYENQINVHDEQNLIMMALVHDFKTINDEINVQNKPCTQQDINGNLKVYMKQHSTHATELKLSH